MIPRETKGVQKTGGRVFEDTKELSPKIPIFAALEDSN